MSETDYSSSQDKDEVSILQKLNDTCEIQVESQILCAACLGCKITGRQP